MLFNTKRSPRKTTRQTLSTEQLEPKAMFSVSPVEPVVALDVGPVNQASYDCEGSGTCSADDFMKIGDIKGEFRQTLSLGGASGPGGTSFMTGEDGRMIVHPSFNVGLDGYIATTEDANEASFNVGNDGRSIVHPQFNVGGTAGPGGSTFMTDTGGRSIVHPSFNVGNDGRSIVHPSFNVGNDGRSIVHPSFNVGNNVLAQANQQPHLTAIRDVDIASESIGGSAGPGGDDVFMPKPNREIVGAVKGNGYAEAVGLDSSTVVTSSSDSYTEVEWTYFAARQEVFARMGR